MCYHYAKPPPHIAMDGAKIQPTLNRIFGKQYHYQLHNYRITFMLHSVQLKSSRSIIDEYRTARSALSENTIALPHNNIIIKHLSELST